MDKMKPVEITNEKHHLDSKRYAHPAFGKIGVYRIQGTPFNLFGSALKHQHAVHIEIETATLERHNNVDRVCGDKSLVSFYMSESQWAHFVASAGLGEGTPITFDRRPADGYQLQGCPQIESIETIRDTHTREIGEAVAEIAKGADDIIEKIQELASKGKAGKKELEALLFDTKVYRQNMTPNATYVQKTFVEAMEKTVQAGKTEIEAFVSDMATRTGLEMLRNGVISLPGEKKE